MLGYWDPASPVKTDKTNVLVTTYLKNNQALARHRELGEGTAAGPLDN